MNGRLTDKEIEDIKLLQQRTVNEGFGIRVGDKVRPKNPYRQLGTYHAGEVVSINGLSCNIKLNNGNIMENIAVSYLEKMHITNRKANAEG